MSVQLLQSLRLQNVRSHKQADFQFEKHVNAIVGPNGSGKTTILEALYTLLAGTSFRGSLPEEVQWGQNQAVMELSLNGESFRRLVINTPEDSFAQKHWNVDDEKSGRLPLQKRMPVVLFEPDIGRMISGSPERRRSYIDGLSSQLDLSTAQALSRYERILKQRNALLKKLSLHSQTRSEKDQLFVWNTQLAKLSEVIVSARIQTLETLQKRVTKQYNKLGGSDTILLSYGTKVTSDPTTYANKLHQFLDTSLPRDIALGHTSFGPHRDDIEIRLADQSAKERASRGEIRTLVLALKLLEAEILQDAFSARNMRPTLLFDDVLSELDLYHQEQILAGFKNYQVFLTTTDAHTLTPGTYTIALD